MRIVLLGAPGSGKGTQAKRIAEAYKIPHIPVNDLVRAAVAADTPLGRQIKAVMEARQPITDDMLLGVIQERLTQPDTRSGFILDGFPRNITQAEALDAMAESIGQPLEAAVVIDVDFETLLERFTGRRTCVSCGRTYNIYTSPSRLDDRCDECGGNLRHRADDKEETISNRLRVYEAQIVPVLEYYRKRGILHTVQGDGEIDEIFEEIKAVLDSLAAAEKSAATKKPEEPPRESKESADQQPVVAPPGEEAATEDGAVARAVKVALAAAEEVVSTIAEAVPAAGKKTVRAAKKVAKAAEKGVKSVAKVARSQKGKAASTAKKAPTKASRKPAGAKKSGSAPKKAAPKKATPKKAAPEKAVSKKAGPSPKKAASKKPAAKKPSVKAVAVKAAAPKKAIQAVAAKKSTARSAAAAKETAKRVTKQPAVKETSVKKAPAKKKTASGKASAKRR